MKHLLLTTIAAVIILSRLMKPNRQASAGGVWGLHSICGSTIPK